MTAAAQAAGELLAVENALARIPSLAMRNGGEALIEWLDEQRAKVRATRKALEAVAVPAVLPLRRDRIELGRRKIAGRVVVVEARGRAA